MMTAHDIGVRVIGVGKTVVFMRVDEVILMSSIVIRLIQQRKCPDIHLYLIYATCFGRNMSRI
jgi:hypothetical protein